MNRVSTVCRRFLTETVIEMRREGRALAETVTVGFSPWDGCFVVSQLDGQLTVNNPVSIFCSANAGPATSNVATVNMAFIVAGTFMAGGRREQGRPKSLSE